MGLIYNFIIVEALGFQGLGFEAIDRAGHGVNNNAHGSL